MEARTVAGRGQKSLLCDPGSGLRVGRRERRWTKIIINGGNKKTYSRRKYTAAVGAVRTKQHEGEEDTGMLSEKGCSSVHTTFYCLPHLPDSSLGHVREEYFLFRCFVLIYYMYSFVCFDFFFFNASRARTYL